MMVANCLTTSLSNYLPREFRNFAFVLFWVALVAGWFLINRLPGWFHSLRARSWPLADGRIETGNVKEFGQQALGELGYSYFVEGNRYSGYFSWQFGDEQQAWDYVTKLKGQPVAVRYLRKNPDVSALRNADQSQTNLRGSGFLNTIWTALMGQLHKRI
jgi:Protein of unknown function (DUF3592)